jgi:hypothetical protein
VLAGSRGIDTKIAAAELSGQVFGLKKPEDFGGNYQKIEMQTSVSGSASRATMKNQNEAQKKSSL